MKNNLNIKEIKMKNTVKFFALLMLLTLLSGCGNLFDNNSNSNDNTGSNTSNKNITVTPSKVTLARGETQQFTTSGQSYWGVKWSLEGAVGNSSINSSGLLTVGMDETASTLTVKATDNDNYSIFGTATVTIAAPSATPQGLKASRPGPNSIEISWQPLSGVNQYTIQRSVNGTTFGQIGTASGTSYTDSAVGNDTSYYYRISANGVNSNVIFAFAANYFNLPVFSQRKLIPLAASGKHYYRFAVNSGSEYTMEWQNGNNQAISDYIHFRVIAYQNDGTQIFNRDSWNSNGYTNPSVFTATTTGFVTIFVSNESNSSQDYQIYFYGSDGVVDSGTVALPPYKISAFRVSSPNQSSITLTWDSVSDAAKYNIYRANIQTGTPGKIGESNTTSYTDNQVSEGASYWYTITAVNANGLEGCRFQGAFGFAASHYTLSYYNGAQILSLTASGKHYYRLAVTQGNSYTIEWQNGNNQAISDYIHFRVVAYQNNGTQIFNRDSWNSNGYTNPSVFTATYTGFVTIMVSNESSAAQNYQIYYY